ncbi:MAG: futalosine hydrolase [Bacteroidia bacterium]|nr:futalosine hydrolase [Bacteroidia bacterium]
MAKNTKKILIVSATEKEIKPTILWMKNNFGLKKLSSTTYLGQNNKIEIEILITGVGMVATAYQLGKRYLEKYNCVLNIGICGAFDRNLKLGELVIIKEDCFSEFGAEDGNNFLKSSEIQLGTEKIVPKKFHVPNIFKSIKLVKGITVNTVHGDKKSIEKIMRLFHPQVETMEGAAFYYACHLNKWKCLSLRSISNYVEKRNKKSWKIQLAIQNLNAQIIQYLSYE